MCYYSIVRWKGARGELGGRKEGGGRGGGGEEGEGRRGGDFPQAVSSECSVYYSQLFPIWGNRTASLG